MNITEKTSLLIASLSKSEKRGFKLFFLSRQESNKGYLLLFEELADKGMEYLEEVSDSFYRKTGFQPASCAGYLYQQILKYLTFENTYKSIKASIYNQIERAKILFERNLIQDGFDELAKAKDSATLYEDDLLLLMIDRTEIRFHEKTDFVYLKEKELVSFQMSQLETLKQSRSIEQHKFLYNILNHRILYKRYSTDEARKKAYDDLVISELNLKSNNHLQGFEIDKLHLLFQANYYLEMGKTLPAVRNFHTLLELFEEYPHLKLTPPAYYLNVLEGMIKTLLQAEEFDQIALFIDKITDLKTKDYPQDFILQLHRIEFFSRIEITLRQGRFDQVLPLKNSFEEVLCQKISQLHPNHQIRYYIYLAAFYLYTDRIKEARKALLQVITRYKVLHKQPLFKHIYLLYILCKAQEGDAELTAHEISSFRYRYKKEDIHPMEKIVLSFAKEYPLPSFKRGKEEIWKKYGKKFEEIRQDKYSRHLFSIFHYHHYIESRLTGSRLVDLFLH